jgi:hypothetical protein
MDMVLLADVVIPIHTFSEETVGPIMVFGDCAQNHQAIKLVLARAALSKGRRLEILAIIVVAPSWRILACDSLCAGLGVKTAFVGIDASYQ